MTIQKMRTSHLRLQVAVFDRGKLAAPRSSHPFLSIPSLGVRAHEATSHGVSGRRTELSYSLDVASILLSSTPRQLEVLACAARNWVTLPDCHDRGNCVEDTLSSGSEGVSVSSHEVSAVEDAPELRWYLLFWPMKAW